MALTGSISILLRGVAPAVLLLAAGACQAPGTLPDRTVTGAAAPATVPLPPLPVAGSRHFVVDPSRSDVRILVYRGGPLARVGHNHVLRVHELAGEVYLGESAAQSAFRISFPVSALEIDRPADRADEGGEFATPLSEQAIEATRANLLGPAVLDAARYPVVSLQSVAAAGPAWGPTMTVRVTLHGREHDLVVPVALSLDGDRLVATAFLTLRTSDFGMTPFSALGGGLQVQDEVRIRAHIVATTDG